MAVTSWVPVQDQDDGKPHVIAAQVNGSLLTDIITQAVLPVAREPMTEWLLSETGYVWPTPRGRGWPR